MSFRPSRQSNYGWSSSYPESSFLVGSQRGRGGIPSQYRANASMLSDTLAQIPFSLQITSGYRNPEVNRQVGGARGSSHTKAAAADIKAKVGGVPIPNFVLGTWLWVHKNRFPYLDQVITYTDKGHLHVGVSERPRRTFLVSTSGQTRSWTPNPADLPMHLTGIDPRVVRSWLPQLVIATSLSAVVVALAWRYQDEIRSRLGV